MNTASKVVSVSQGAAGTTTVYTPGSANRVYVTGLFLTLDAAGTIKFTETAGDLTGAMNAGGTSAAPVSFSDGGEPILWTTTAGEALKITTATGKAQGWVTLFEAL